MANQLKLLPCVLGTGRSCVVQLGIDKGEIVAVKLLDLEWVRTYKNHVKREIVHHQDVSIYRHPYIVQLKRVTLVPPNIALILEHVQGKSLDTLLFEQGGYLPLPSARWFFQQLIIALDFLHSMKKVNRDISLANIMIDMNTYPYTAKLCDFSYVKDDTWDSKQKSHIGTALFAAPEIYTTKPGETYDGALADVFAAGVVLCMMVSGQHPFLLPQDVLCSPSEVMLRLMHNALHGLLQLPRALVYAQPDLVDLLARMLHPNVSERIRVAQVLQHPWFQTDLPVEWLSINQQLANSESNMNNSVGCKISADEVTALIDEALNAAQ